MDTSETYKDSIVNPLTPLEKVETGKWYEDPVYIKMCEKAKEIQEGWKPQYGDYIGGQWFIDTEDNIGLTQLGIVLSYDADKKLLNTGGDILWSRETNIWLPRQDQLQDMVGDYRTLNQYLAAYYDAMLNWKEYMGETREDYWENTFTSMEQLWLAFVMKEKYNKVWNGEKWIII